MTILPRLTFCSLLAAAASVSMPPEAQAQWSVTRTVLNPAPTYHTWDWTAAYPVLAATSTRRVGNAEFGQTTHAGTWNGAAGSWVDLHPTGALMSEAFGAFGNQQVGQVDFTWNGIGGNPQASLWNGSAASWVNLNPDDAIGSVAYATSGAHQVGVAFTWAGMHASLWSGTAASWVDLHPAGLGVGSPQSMALGVSGSEQVGSVDVDFSPHASLWHGSADSWIDLHPDSAVYSFAFGTSGTQQVGFAFMGSNDHASLWYGSANSWIDLNPIGSLYSRAYATNGVEQVGVVDRSASLWRGTAASWENLGLALTGSWRETVAVNIWNDSSFTYVAGYGFNNDTNRYEALLWTRPVPEPSSFLLLTLSGLMTTRRRRG